EGGARHAVAEHGKRGADPESAKIPECENAAIVGEHVDPMSERFHIEAPARRALHPAVTGGFEHFGDAGIGEGGGQTCTLGRKRGETFDLSGVRGARGIAERPQQRGCEAAAAPARLDVKVDDAPARRIRPGRANGDPGGGLGFRWPDNFRRGSHDGRRERASGGASPPSNNCITVALDSSSMLARSRLRITALPSVCSLSNPAWRSR